MALVMALALLAGCSSISLGSQQRRAVESQELQFTHPQAGDTIAVFNTSAGEFRAVLFPALAPQACENFLTLAAQGYYDGVTFTRVEAGFIIEAGQDANGGTTTVWNGNGYPIEVTDKLHHYSGALCVALDEAGEGQSVFYVVDTPASLDKELVTMMSEAGWRQEVIDAYSAGGGAPYLDYTDTVFGQVYEGMETVDAIGGSDTDEDGRPTESVTIYSISLESYAG